MIFEEIKVTERRIDTFFFVLYSSLSIDNKGFKQVLFYLEPIVSTYYSYLCYYKRDACVLKLRNTYTITS